MEPPFDESLRPRPATASADRRGAKQSASAEPTGSPFSWPT